MSDEVPSRAARSFSAITALIVRQQPRGACRERRKRGQSGHEEDERFNTSGRGPRMVHERSPATLHLPSRPPNRFKMAFRPRFGMFLPHHDPKSPYSPVNFVCMYPIEPTEDCPGLPAQGSSRSCARTRFGVGVPPMSKIRAKKGKTWQNMVPQGPEQCLWWPGGFGAPPRRGYQ